MTDSFRTHDGRTLEQAASDLIQREVLCCMSSMVSMLAAGSNPCADSLADLVNRAIELAVPALDYEEAAREENYEIREVDGCWDWKHEGDEWPAEPISIHRTADMAWAACCADNDIEPHEIEVYEHWAVSTWLAEKLQAAGERVDTDFAGLNVWARTTTGQAISMDAVIERITCEMHAA